MTVVSENSESLTYPPPGITQMEWAELSNSERANYRDQYAIGSIEGGALHGTRTS